ncbi:hypothetical protein CathTA2_0824 [Caldalkalibacillus thermarum TA2.A1]|uniref:TraD/TraG TraM recognition site domain-containing protein n=1 Tax=Caldalkalibacillus thermarum (strain TA2.A1) TaxID=986075 RepID=F5L4W1_CALTT|nr:type IV secretory system conjugative DNA transfer family protein [Caldalkalibacillus thermarum]EGL83613.1 hypothetical protein CathTA2_0824 [Caldalkalibacillus thermarum TA2.A1]
MDRPIIWGGSDAFTHMLVVGPTRCGKTATILKPIIYNLLVQKAKGKKLGLSVIEPKGDVAFMVREMCEEMGLDFVHIDPAQKRGYAESAGYDPSYESHRFNPMTGDEDTVAEATVAVLKSLFGKQEAFFATVQEVSARNVTKLLKRLQGDRLDLGDVVNTLRDLKLLEYKVNELVQRQGEDDLTKFFKAELLGAMKDKYRQFVIGLRAQLENLTANRHLRSIMTGESSFDIDKHFEEGGVLAVNTALGELGSSGDAFGQYIIMHLQAGTFRRGGTEKTRVPHFLIVDEYSRYINPDIERFLNIAAEYRVAGIFACQSLSQLEVETGKMSGRAVKRAILNGCRNKICFGGITSEDAKEFAEEFGKKQIIVRQATYDTRIIGANIFPAQYRDTEQEEYRFFYTQLMDGLPRFHFVYKVLKDGTPQPPKIGKGRFIPRDWKKRREWVERAEVKKRSIFDLLSSLRKANPAKPVLSRKANKEQTFDKDGRWTVEGEWTHVASNESAGSSARHTAQASSGKTDFEVRKIRFVEAEPVVFASQSQPGKAGVVSQSQPGSEPGRVVWLDSQPMQATGTDDPAPDHDKSGKYASHENTNREFVASIDPQRKALGEKSKSLERGDAVKEETKEHSEKQPKSEPEGKEEVKKRRIRQELF